MTQPRYKSGFSQHPDNQRHEENHDIQSFFLLQDLHQDKSKWPSTLHQIHRNINWSQAIYQIEPSILHLAQILEINVSFMYRLIRLLAE